MTNHPHRGQLSRNALELIEKIPCPHCNARFAAPADLYQHAKAKHGRRAAQKLKPNRDNEPSMADLVIDAQIARAAGEPVEEWLAEMFDI